MPTRHLAALLLTLLLAMPATATAAESPMPTRQAVAYGMDWVPYIDPTDLPPVAQRKVVCLVDSGVDITPDLPPDNFAGPIVERISVDGGSGLPGSAWENQHGTRMALIAGAVPGNDYGTVGAWPAVRILSVRAMGQDERVFHASYYDWGLRTCQDASARLPVAVVNLSLGCDCALSDRERTELTDAIGSVHDQGIGVVAAAGNSGGGPQTPADNGGVLAVAAASVAGDLCASASWSEEAVAGPGCGVETASDYAPSVPVTSDSPGSSGAAIATSTLLALLRTLRPDADWRDAEDWVQGTATAASTNGPKLVNGERAARAAGLGPIVERAKRRMPIAPVEESHGIEAPTPSPSGRQPAPARVRLPLPRATVKWRKGRLVVHLAARPYWAERLSVVNQRRRRMSSWTRTLRRVVVLRATRPPKRLSLRFLPYPGAEYLPSASKRLRLSSSGSYR
jgi:hypothetical protein